MEEMKYRSAYENARDAIVTADLDSFRIVDVNRSAALLTGFTREELVGMPIYQMHLEEEFPIIQEHIQNLKNGRSGGGVFIISIRHKDGHYIPVEVSVGDPFPLNGQTLIVGFIRDISARLKSEEEINEKNENHRLLISKMTQGLAVHELLFDENGRPNNYRFLEINPSFEKMTGVKRELVLGRTVLDVFPGTESYWIDTYGQVATTGIPVKYENYAKELGRFYEVVAYSPKKNQFVTLVSDITERKEAENLLIRAKENAESANDAKSRFLANMSHEIRTPMNGFIGLLQLLSLTPLNELQRSYINMAKKSSDALLEIINDILDYSKIEAGMMELRKESFHISALLKDIINLYQIVASAKGLNILIDFDEKIPESLIGDPFRVRQVLSNLIGNALKFTNIGSIHINVQELYRIGENRVKLNFSISDTGIGIPDEKLHMLFRSFSQIEDSNSRFFGGAGLGLAISKNLVEMMGGDIWVESQESLGSCFSFTAIFDIDKNAEVSSLHTSVKQAQKSDLSIKDLHILLAEDDPLNAQILVEYIRFLGWHSVVAQDGLSALKESQTSRFDVILMDIQMPGMDGYQVCELIRGNEKNPNHFTPIIALTANAFEEDREKCLASGMNDYLSKPLLLSDLKATVTALFP